ncbi:hypothetical protein HDU76_013360 [Blyttiomyces sp. JEL0837]|nr:hypothetical protein HDU76_013360 [Blyttiomyces sp. JEL0837]
MNSLNLGGGGGTSEYADDEPAEEMIPCENFNLVCKGVYRSAFPKKKNFPFLKKLGLRSILTLILEDYPDLNKRFGEENNIQLFQFGVAGNKHRTGCLVGCLRKLQHWSFTSIFEEYRRFSHPKSRSMDQQFIELFEIRNVIADPAWLPSWPEISDGIGATLVPGGVDVWLRLLEFERSRSQGRNSQVEMEQERELEMTEGEVEGEGKVEWRMDSMESIQAQVQDQELALGEQLARL